MLRIPLAILSYYFLNYEDVVDVLKRLVDLGHHFSYSLQFSFLCLYDFLGVCLLRKF